MDGFIHQTGIPSDQVYAPNGAAADLAAEALRLTQVLERTLPKSPINDVPQFDLIFLGMGTDGHTASLFPGTTALDSMAKGYVANDVPQLETKRLTLTFPVLNAAKHLVIMATGANKAKVLSEIFNRTGKNPVYPVEYLAAEKITWMLDFMAASQIPRDLLQRHRSS
jgi:6-phosphogluconolactonase